MIEVQIPTLLLLPAVLAGIRVPFEDILPGQLDLFFWDPVKKHQHNDPWNSDSKADGPNRILTLIILAELPPAMKIKGPEIVPRAIALHHLGVAHVKQAKGPADGADVNRLPKAVED